MTVTACGGGVEAPRATQSSPPTVFKLHFSTGGERPESRVEWVDVSSGRFRIEEDGRRFVLNGRRWLIEDPSTGSRVVREGSPRFLGPGPRDASIGLSTLDIPSLTSAASSSERTRDLIEELLILGGAGALLGFLIGLLVSPWRSVIVAVTLAGVIWAVWWETAGVVGMGLGFFNAVAATIAAAGVAAVRARRRPSASTPEADGG